MYMCNVIDQDKPNGGCVTVYFKNGSNYHAPPAAASRGKGSAPGDSTKHDDEETCAIQ